MANFVFKMQSLLNIKTQMEESLKNELGKAIQKLELEKNKLKKIEIDRDECINNLKLKSTKGIIVYKIQEYNSYISLLKERMKIQKENINYAQNVVDKYREQLIKMMQEKEMLEKLKDKKYQEYLLEQAKADHKVNDEVISYKYSKITIEN
jgi:flagellar protein FliJ